MENPTGANCKKCEHQNHTTQQTTSLFFGQQEPPLTDKILNAYELKTRPEIVRYYHVAAGFSTKPSWLAAIKNRHYISWTGLNYLSVAKYFPESKETWKGHGSKMKSGLGLVKQALTDDLYC